MVPLVLDVDGKHDGGGGVGASVVVGGGGGGGGVVVFVVVVVVVYRFIASETKHQQHASSPYQVNLMCTFLGHKEAQSSHEPIGAAKEQQ